MVPRESGKYILKLAPVSISMKRLFPTSSTWVQICIRLARETSLELIKERVYHPLQTLFGE
jgi:hypothetical protein